MPKTIMARQLFIMPRERKHLDTVKMLIEKGADINAKDSDGQDSSSLCHAAERDILIQ